jgi:sodium/bile acid cotransporter 7
VLLTAVLSFTRYSSRWLGFSREDEAAVVFCGSKKSLVTGVPMANILFPASVAGLVILPVMLFHQLQLIVCSVLAQRYAVRSPPSPPA